MSTSNSNWQSTKLWQDLSESTDHDAPAVRNVVEAWMNDIETVLRSGGTTPTDFTLHDEQHACRVAQRMVEIIPSETREKLTPYDLAFLLLSAYLHDIGMTPHQKKVSTHYAFLLTGDPNCLTEQAANEFQAWLDNDEEGITPPLCNGTPTPDQLAKACRLVAYYCRHRHNDWSEEWIRQNAPIKSTHRTNGRLVPLGTFEDWLEDLIRLCRSHHYGKAALLKPEFDPRSVGSPAKPINVRYLACVLRMADILEFDPERTPEVIFQQRDICAESVVYWHKDHGVSRVLENGKLTLTARPKTARLYRAVEEMIDQIDTELRLCHELAEEKPFNHCPGASEPPPYKWNMATTVYRDLKPDTNTFTYINGSFRPNAHRIRQLLAGVQLYHEPLAALRELLQNALDAVREQIAYERLEQPDPADNAWEGILQKRHRVSIRLEKGGDGCYLTCTDTGIGMTKNIIENFFLVGGQQRRHDIAELERRCRKHDFTTGRTGQFGIGVLSYFMIADGLKLETRRNQAANDMEPTGWSFGIDGIADWGELRPSNSMRGGTRVRLQLKPDVAADPNKFYSEAVQYLSRIIRRLPCEVELTADLAACNATTFQPGWSISPDQLSPIQPRDVAYNPGHFDDEPTHDLLPRTMKLGISEKKDQARALARDATERRRWIAEEGMLENKLGHYRISIPYFDLLGSPCLAFLNLKRDGQKVTALRIGEGFAYFSPFRLGVSWKGLDVHYHARDLRIGEDPRHPNYLAAHIDIDLGDSRGGTVGVDRSRLYESAHARQAIRSVVRRARDMMEQFTSDNSNSAFATLNVCLSRTPNVIVRPPYWLSNLPDGNKEETLWQPIAFPYIDEKYDWYVPKRASEPFRHLSAITGPREYVAIPLNLGFSARIMYIEGGGFPRATVLVEKISKSQPADKCMWQIAFPPTWKSVVGINRDYYCVWNRSNALVKLVTTESWDWARSMDTNTTDPISIKNEILSCRESAASWLLCMLIRRSRGIWLGLVEREPEFLEEVWQKVFPSRRATLKEIVFWNLELGNTLHLVSKNSWKLLDSRNAGDCKAFREALPRPSKEWIIEAHPPQIVFKRRRTKR